jgi:hypothetical protein
MLFGLLCVEERIRKCCGFSIHIHHLCRIPNPWYPRCVGKSGANDQPILIYSPRPLRPAALSGSPHSVVKHLPLSSVGVPGKNKLDRAGNKRQVFRVVREKNVIAGSGTVLLQPSCLWLVSRCCNRPANSADAFLAWVTIGAAGFGTETSIVRNVAGRKTADDHPISFGPAVVKKHHAGCSKCGEILLIHHPFVVAERHEGRSNGSAGGQERQDVGLRLKRRPVSLRPATIQHVAGDADEGRPMRLERRNHRRGIRIMEVGKQRQIWRSGDVVDCLFRRGSPPEKELTVKPGT